MCVCVCVMCVSAGDVHVCGYVCECVFPSQRTQRSQRQTGGIFGKPLQGCDSGMFCSSKMPGLFLDRVAQALEEGPPWSYMSSCTAEGWEANPRGRGGVLPREGRAVTASEQEGKGRLREHVCEAGRVSLGRGDLTVLMAEAKTAWFKHGSFVVWGWNHISSILTWIILQCSSAT